MRALFAGLLIITMTTGCSAQLGKARVTFTIATAADLGTTFFGQNYYAKAGGEAIEHHTASLTPAAFQVIVNVIVILCAELMRGTPYAAILYNIAAWSHGLAAAWNVGQILTHPRTP